MRHQPVMVEPRGPFERGEFDSLLAFPWCPPVNQLGLVQTVDGLGQGVVVAVALAAHRGLDAGLGQPLGVADAVVGPGRRLSSRSAWRTQRRSVSLVQPILAAMESMGAIAIRTAPGTPGACALSARQPRGKTSGTSS